LLSKVSPGIFTPCTTVLVAEPQPLFRDAVTRAIRQRASLALAGEPNDGRAVLASIRELRPDVAVLCPPLPGLDADGVLNAIRRDELATRTVLMLPSLTPEGAVASVARGAAACLSKDASGDDVCRAIEAAARGQAFFAPEIQTLLA
jgi:DNA-binding NarL/FixJ family response regulator